MIGKAAAARLTGQNVRGLTTLKLEKLVQFMRSSGSYLITCDGNVASDKRRVGV